MVETAALTADLGVGRTFGMAEGSSRAAAKLSLSLWLLVIAWSLKAVVSSIPWFLQGGRGVFVWAHNPGLLAVIGLHAASALSPIIAAASLWRQQSLIACLSLALLSNAWLFWHIWMFTQLAPAIRDGARILLSVTTLVVVAIHSMRQARSKMDEAAPGVG